MTVIGSGFSFAAAENVLSVGDTSVSAEAYEINSDGDETLRFTLPENAVAGDASLLAIVGGRVSNPIDFTVLPTP